MNICRLGRENTYAEGDGCWSSEHAGCTGVAGTPICSRTRRRVTIDLVTHQSQLHSDLCWTLLPGLSQARSAAYNVSAFVRPTALSNPNQQGVAGVMFRDATKLRIKTVLIYRIDFITS